MRKSIKNYTNNEYLLQGEILWRLAHTAMATSWTAMINQKREYDACAGVQLVLSSLLSQVYAALSRVRFSSD